MTDNTDNQTPVMPEFAFEDLSTEDAEALNTKSSPRIAPGLYTVEITESIYSGPTRKDPSWFKLSLKLATVDGVVYDTVLVPTKGYTYGDQQQKFPLHRLKEFLAGIGESDDITILKKTIPKAFGKDGSKLIGRKCEVRLDYRDNRLEMVDGVVKLLDKKGEPMKDAAGVEMTFPDFGAGKNYCKAENISTFGFVKVAEYVSKATKAKSDDVPF